MTSDQLLTAKATRAAMWSGVASIVLRLGGLVVGIVLARILTPREFGVYAVALTAQAILMTVADLGLSADIVRSDQPERIAPTVGALGLISGGALSVITVAVSNPLAAAMGSDEAGPAIAVLACTLLLGGATVVPYGMLQRRFQQRELFVVGAADFVVSTTVTLTLVLLGWGVLGLAVGRVAAQSISTVLQFWFSRTVPRYRIDRSVLRPVLAFGLPIAAANLLSWGLLNVDNVVLAHIAGATALGYYVLAFNISNWPMNALAQMVRSVTLPYFSRVDRAADALPRITAVAWAAALPAGVTLAVLSSALVEVVYGARWLPSAPVLAALGLYGGLRVVFDVVAGFLYSQGESRGVLWVQVVWFAVLVVAMVPVTMAYGIVGGGWVHVGAAVLVVLPAYCVVLARSGVRVRRVLAACAPPTVAAVPAAAAAWVVQARIDDALGALVVGALLAGTVYGVLLARWARAELVALRARSGEA